MNLSLRGMVRPERIQEPVLTQNGRKYACPVTYVACNDHFFDVQGGQDYVVCIPVDLDKSENCPITSVAFVVPETEQNLYKRR